MIFPPPFSLALAYDRLFLFANTENFWDVFSTSFGNNYDLVKATTLRNQWQAQDFSNFPEIEVVVCQVEIDGYNWLNLMRASSVVNCQLTGEEV